MSPVSDMDDNMQRRTFLKVIGGVAILPAISAINGCSTALPYGAVTGWRQPCDETDIRRWILSYALLAPHSHNLQSWSVDLRESGKIILYCDQTRLLPETDPYFRQTMISHGAFLELLDIAARERGIRADIELFPRGAFDWNRVDGRPVAHICLHQDPSIKKDCLFAQILKRRTNRNPYDPNKLVSNNVWQKIIQAHKNDNVITGYVDLSNNGLVLQHRKIACDAWRTELSTPRIVLESYKVLRVGSDEILKHRDGISVTDPKVVWLERLGFFDRFKAPEPDSFTTTNQLNEFAARLESTPSFFWMKTSGNDRFSQVDVGRAYVRIQLMATAYGVAMQPLQQALQEYTEQRQHYKAIHSLCDATHDEVVQMWTRVGYATDVPPSPRRDLNEIIRT